MLAQTSARSRLSVCQGLAYFKFRFLRRPQLTPPRRKPTIKTIDPDTQQAVRRFVTLMAEQLAEQFDIASVILYGSRARGTHRQDSDADVAVLLKGEHQRRLKPP